MPLFEWLALYSGRPGLDLGPGGCYSD